MNTEIDLERIKEYGDRTQAVFNEVVFERSDIEVIGFYYGQLGAALRSLIAKNPLDEKRIIDLAKVGFHSTMEKVKQK